MIINSKKLEKFEKELEKKSKVDVIQNFQIVEALYREAVTLHVIPMKDPLDGLEVDIRIARVVNSVFNASKKAQGEKI